MPRKGNNMDIKQRLPFEHCETCPQFLLDVDEQAIFMNGQTTRFLEVKCKNEWLCRQLEKHLSEVIVNEKTMS